MNEILVNSLSVSQRTNKSKPMSVLQLQSLKAKNQKKEHGKLVAKMKTTYGSLWKARKVLNVHWRTFHRLPAHENQKEINMRGMDRHFYVQDNVSFEMPIARASGRWFLTKTLEESYHMYWEDCKKSDKKGVSFSTFCCLRPKNIY